MSTTYVIEAYEGPTEGIETDLSQEELRKVAILITQRLCSEKAAQ